MIKNERLKNKKSASLSHLAKIGAIILLLVGVVFVSGCTSPDSAKSSTDSPAVASTPITSGPSPLVVKTPPPPLKIPGSVTPVSTTPKAVATPKATNVPKAQATTAPASITFSGLEKLLIEQSDVPEFPLADWGFMAAPTSGQPPQIYKELPAGIQVFQQTSVWGDPRKHGVSSQVMAVDFNGYFTDIDIKAKNCEIRGDAGCGSANIGDKSYFMDAGSDATGVWQTGVQFTKGTNCVSIIVVTDNQKTSHDTALYVAKQVLSRLK